jgi:hypothetical protein
MRGSAGCDHGRSRNILVVLTQANGQKPTFLPLMIRRLDGGNEKGAGRILWQSQPGSDSSDSEQRRKTHLRYHFTDPKRSMQLFRSQKNIQLNEILVALNLDLAWVNYLLFP